MGKEPTNQSNPVVLSTMDEGMQAVILRGIAANILLMKFPRLDNVKAAFDQFGIKLVSNTDLVQAFDGSIDVLESAEIQIRAFKESHSRIKGVIASAIGNGMKIETITKILAET